MKHHFSRLHAAALVACCLAASTTWAHGPDGDHAEPASAGPAQVGAARLEAKSELFELVAHLQGGQLSILIDRYATNEPLLKAAVEVESGAVKAKAKMQTEAGDFVVDDPALLKLLGTPGEHPLLITVVSGDEADLLEGVLRTAAASSTGSDHGPRWLPGWAIALVATLPALLAWAWHRKVKRRSKFAGEAA